MQSLKLIQIGDIHYPDAQKSGQLVDCQDDAMPKWLIQQVSADRLRNALRAVVTVCERDERVSGIMLCGDLTSRGHIEGYRKCLEYLNDALQITNRERWQEQAVHVVPGNHDIDRDLCDPAHADPYRKFGPLESAWQDLGMPILRCESVRRTRIALLSCAAEVFSANSCVGCGERRSLPCGVAEQLQEVLREYKLTALPEDSFKVIGEELDTPAFREEHVTTIAEAIGELDPTVLPVVLAHHNVLPQAVPRVSIYTEVINSGLVRSRLSQRRRPVIFCHGHVHDDPVEIVRSPTPDTGPLVCVSAPELVDGFNVLEVEFGSKGHPLGCTLTAHRARRDGLVEEDVSKGARVAFHGPGRLSELGDERIAQVLPHIAGDGHVRFRDVHESVQTSMPTRPQKRTLANILLEAEWFALVSILNRQKEPEQWQIRRTVP
jgi:hypothetical protein